MHLHKECLLMAAQGMHEMPDEMLAHEMPTKHVVHEMPGDEPQLENSMKRKPVASEQ